MKRGRKSGSTPLNKFDGAIRNLAKLGKSIHENSAFVGTATWNVRLYCHLHNIPVARKARAAQVGPKADRNKQLCDLFLTGKTLQEVGDVFGITRERVRQVLNANGISDRYLWTIANSADRDHALHLYELGETPEVIEERIGAKYASIFNAIKPSRKSQERRRINQFWRMAAITANPDKCWNWQGSTTGGQGHGHVSWRGQSKGSHVVAFMLANGRKAPKWVLHHCDNPKCINPKHLYAGTPLDNSRDRDRRGRGAYQNGKKPGDYRLTLDEVDRIRRLLKTGIPQIEIAKAVGVSFGLVNAINTGKAWANPRPICVLPSKTIKQIYEGLRSNSFTQASVTKTYGLSPNTVLQIKRGVHWRVKQIFTEQAELS